MKPGTIAVMLILCTGVAGLALLRAPSFSTTETSLASTTIDTHQADLNGDGQVEVVQITYKTVENGHPMGGEIVVMRETAEGLVPIWRERNLNPWKLRLADVDGDGEKEIIVGVWKKSPKDPVMARRVFVWSWNGERMLPKWLGSRLSRRFEDFEVRDINNDGWAELLAMEISPGKPKRIGMYRWRSFGFDWLGSAEPDKWKELAK